MSSNPSLDSKDTREKLKKLKNKSLPRESRAEKLSILSRHEEEKKNPTIYKSLESLSRRKQQTRLKSEELLIDLSCIDLSIPEISTSQYSQKKKELLKSKRNIVTNSVPALSSTQIDYVKNLEMGIPLKIKEWIPSLETESIKKSQKIGKSIGLKIDLKELVGQCQDLLLDKIVFWGEYYESQKNDLEWNSDADLIVFEIETLSPISIGKDEEISSRILDIFKDGPIADLTYKDDAKTIVKFGTFKALVDALLFPLSSQDSSYILEFLYGYRFFMGSVELLDGLMSWYNVDVQNGQKFQVDFLKQNRRNIQKKVLNVLNLWIKNYWDDFLRDRELYKNLHFFLHCLSQVSFVDYQKISQGIREQWLNWYTFVYVPPFTSINISSSVEGNFSILEMDSTIWATYITAIDKTYFSQIRENCYVSLLYSSCSHRGGAYHTGLKLILEAFSWFRSLSFYVCTIIDSQDTIKKRSKAIQKCIKVGKYLYDFGDFQGAFAIMHGLTRPRSLYVVSAWEGVKQKHLNDFKFLYCFISPKDGYLCYWTQLNSNISCIPFFALHFYEIIRYDSNLSTFLTKKEEIKAFGAPSAERVVNFTKFKEIYMIVSELEKFRTCKFDTKFQINRESLFEMVQYIRKSANYTKDVEPMTERKSSQFLSSFRKSI